MKKPVIVTDNRNVAMVAFSILVSIVARLFAKLRGVHKAALTPM